MPTCDGPRASSRTTSITGRFRPTISWRAPRITRR
ncbi:hypothetical protein APX70_200092 [Pseudomonas syringae pv. maculicola]|uniref:Uncharacterized protein n=1 Tax=Pseudomonas syringae pv. maculicola TaxID=59511 RepID=A0A3M2USF6_PSEYM|nr:hypothetical protein APX70_200092 [Pseudomonas syringae pv. maculicola]